MRVCDGAAVGEGCPEAGQGTKASMCVYNVYKTEKK